MFHSVLKVLFRLLLPLAARGGGTADTSVQPWSWEELEASKILYYFFFPLIDPDAMCLSGDLRLYQIAHSGTGFSSFLNGALVTGIHFLFIACLGIYMSKFLLPHARWMPALTFSLTLRWRFSYLPWNFMWFFFFTSSNPWKGVPATQWKNLIKIISQYIYWILACQALYKAHALFRKIFTKTLWHR